ncbi:MAG TPA: tRNA preQ1(34) S-adenosylmethionine ribosyltransferase-isomerase QueA [Candidatus Krumholzibacteria bacterium]|nr:tRNA preQ1(34) S-adenosylmethionine ribosyltransferase-isomerase QueA [Candidatus Krumholzibacteria bacterium]
MLVDEFSYYLPESLIAQEPASERTASRLMVASRSGDEPPRHETFAKLPEFLRAGDVLVVNRTRVVRARLFASRAKDGLEVEVFFVRAHGEREFDAWARPMRKIKMGDLLHVGEATIRYESRENERDARFAIESGARTVDELLESSGHVPLPPYVHRGDMDADRERYQTVFARERGSVAAPTAGLHFDDALIESLKHQGVEVRELVLHVGPGTFQPLKHEIVEENRLASEAFEIDADTLRAVADAKGEGRRVIAVGTTTTRVLETAAQRGWLEEPFEDRRGETDLFIYPGFQFRAIDGLVTNFHLPRSSLFILVCAFVRTERALALYNEAVARQYRFYSYGDAMLIVP